MVVTAVWHGTQAESNDLVGAIAHNCTCEFGVMSVQVSTCDAHEALLHDQRWLDGLLWERRLRDRRILEEWGKA